MLNVVSSFQYLLLIFGVFLIGFGNVFAQAPSDTANYVYKPLQINDDFELTGKMAHPTWDKAPSTFISNQIQPDDQAPAPVQTEVKVLYSKNNLYVGFINKDPNPNRIRANITDRDKILGDDYVGILLDPYNNNQNAYEFFVNPLGIQMDAMRSGNSEDFNFDALWYSKGSITDTGYISVMKIPFKSINFPEHHIQDWSIQFFRNYPRNNRYQLSWTDIRLNNSCIICQNGVITNIRNIDNSNTVEFLPYGVATQSGTLSDQTDPESNFKNDPVEPKIGGSISYSPSSTSSIDAVVNPDFSQVETDASQISVNETFALFYPEKRPFFMKEANRFTTKEDLFYSRTINNPLAAGKYTQKSDQISINFLSAYDRDTPFIVPGLYTSTQQQSNKQSYSNIVRGKYNLGSESHIGGLITTRNIEEGYNYVGSIDWNFLLTDNYYFSGQTGYSTTKELDDTTLLNDTRTFGNSSYNAALDGEKYSGTLLNAEFSRKAKHYNFSLSYLSYSPTFQAYNGFINQNNLRKLRFSQTLVYYPNTTLLSQGSINVIGGLRYDFAGQLQERYTLVNVNNLLSGQNNFNIRFLPINDERFLGELFENIYKVTFSLNSQMWDIFSFGSSLKIGRDINRTTNPTLGQGYNFSANAELKPTPRFQLSIDYNYSSLSSLDGAENYYKGDIFRVNSRYHLTPKLYTRLIAELDSFENRVHVYPLISYKANPFTKFYMGMTSYATQFDYSFSGGFRNYRQTNRHFFVKFQYLIRN